MVCTESCLIFKKKRTHWVRLIHHRTYSIAEIPTSKKHNIATHWTMNTQFIQRRRSMLQNKVTLHEISKNKILSPEFPYLWHIKTYNLKAILILENPLDFLHPTNKTYPTVSALAALKNTSYVCHKQTKRTTWMKWVMVIPYHDSNKLSKSTV